MEELKPCPFCGGQAKISFKDTLFCGMNGLGDKKVTYRLQAICNKCHARGMPVKTVPLVNPSPYSTKYYIESTKALQHWLRERPKNKQDFMFEPYIEKAIRAWNRRTQSNE